MSLINLNNNKVQSSEQKLKSALYIIATPIGNIMDISYRAINILENSDYIFAENPKNSLNLLKKFNIQTQKLKIYNEYSKKHISNEIINLIKTDKIIALISDAGTPTISDPGYRLIAKIIAEKLPIYAIPGACALINALSVSGMKNDQFHFFGFPPRKDQELQEFLESVKIYNGSLIFYESAKRIENFLLIAKKVFSENSKLLIARELTKLHEEKIYSNFAEISKILTKVNLKGEFVVIIHNEFSEKIINFTNDLKKIIATGSKYLSAKDLKNFLGDISNINKKDIYNLKLKLKNGKK